MATEVTNSDMAIWLDEFETNNPSDNGYIIEWVLDKYWLVNHGNGYISDFKKRYTIKEFFDKYDISTWAEIRVCKPEEQCKTTNYKNYYK